MVEDFDSDRTAINAPDITITVYITILRMGIWNAKISLFLSSIFCLSQI
jgi:hypothetical protein